MNVAIIQARLGSSRLPGKVLEDLAGRPVLHHVVLRAKAIPGVDVVCCAIPDRTEDDPLAAAAESVGAVVVRGPEQDVLARYTLAARACDASTVLRITSDCPVLDPDVSGEVLATFHRGGWDYVANTAPRSWPKGLDIDVFSRAALERAHAEARTPYEREHVTPHIREAEGYRRANIALPSDECADWRWTLDYPQDLEFFRRLLAHVCGPPELARFAELRRIVEANPDLPRINGDRI